MKYYYSAKVLLFLLSMSIIFNSCLFADSFSLEVLFNSADKNIAPKSIQLAMGEYEKDNLLNCCNEIELSPSKATLYFSAVKVNLQKDAVTYIVYPSKYCATFFGAHAISYWLLRENKNNTFSILYAGRSDGIKILPTVTNGYYEIESVYGNSSIILKYNLEQNKFIRTQD
jgi:hypothetical protein